MKKNGLYALLSIVLVTSSIFAVADEVTKRVSNPAEANEPAQKSDMDYAELKSIVSGYMDAWQNGDYNAMHEYEDWTDGETLDGLHYMQKFDPNFGLENWKITKVEPQPNDEYVVLVLIEHNPPKEVSALLPEPKKVRSTLRQFWKKQGESYVHLFHVEKQKLLQPMLDMPKPTGISPEDPHEHE